MLLIGRDLSPFVRRSATLLNLLQIDYDRKEVNTADDAGFIRQHNPLGRVPALVLDDEVIIDSHAIIDFALGTGDAEGKILPHEGAARRQVLYLSSIAIGSMEKGVASAYEKSQRPNSHFYQPYQDKLRGQVIAGLTHLDQRLGDRPWFGNNESNLADVDAAIAYDFFEIVAPSVVAELELPSLRALSERANETHAFSSTRWQGQI